MPGTGGTVRQRRRPWRWREALDRSASDGRTRAVARDGATRHASRAPTAPRATIITCCVCWMPNQATSTRLDRQRADDGAHVFAAYTPPTSRAGSLVGRGDAASASGKLAPQSIGAGSTREQRAEEVELESVNQMLGDEVDAVDRPVRQRVGEHVRVQAIAQHEQHLAPAERDARTS